MNRTKTRTLVIAVLTMAIALIAGTAAARTTPIYDIPPQCPPTC